MTNHPESVILEFPSVGDVCTFESGEDKCRLLVCAVDKEHNIITVLRYMIDPIIDIPVGDGELMLAKVQDGNTWSLYFPEWEDVE